MASIKVEDSTRRIVSMRDMKQGEYGRIVSKNHYEGVVVLAGYGGKIVSLQDGSVWSWDPHNPSSGPRSLMVELYPPLTKIEITI